MSRFHDYSHKSNLQSSEEETEEEAKPTEYSPLIVKEKAQTSCFKLAVLLTYCRTCRWFMAVLTLIFYALAVGASVAANFWLADWSDAEGRDGTVGTNTSGTNVTDGSGPIL